MQLQHGWTSNKASFQPSPSAVAKTAPGVAWGAGAGAKESSSTWQQRRNQNKDSSTWKQRGKNKQKRWPHPDGSQGQKGSTSSAAAAADSGSWDSTKQYSTWNKDWDSKEDERKDWKKWEEGKDWKANEEWKDWKYWEIVDQVHQQDPWKSGAGTSSSAAGHEGSRSSNPRAAVASEDKQKEKEPEIAGCHADLVVPSIVNGTKMA